MKGRRPPFGIFASDPRPSGFASRSTRGPAHRNEAGLWVRFPPSFDSCVWKTWLKENQGEGVSVQ